MYPIVGVALLAPSACADGAVGDPPTTTSSTGAAEAELALPAGVTVFVEFPRYLHAARRLEVGFDNDSTTELTVTDLVLRSPLFEPVVPERADTDIEVGRRRDLQIGLGASVCPAPSGPSMVEVTADIDGVRRHGLVEVDSEPLDHISAQECGSAFVLDRVVVGYAPTFAVTDGVVEATIDIERSAGDDPITVTTTRGSVLIELVPATSSTPLVAVASGDPGASFLVRLRVIRCDPHAVTESKKTFELAIWITVGDREPQRIVVAPEGELRAALEQLIADCQREEAGGDDGPATTTVAGSPDALMATALCTALRDQTNVLAGIANDAVAGIASKSPAERFAAILAGFDVAIDAATRFADTVADLELPAVAERDELQAEVVAGATLAVRQMEDERALFAGDVPEVTDGDVTGRVGQFFNAVEKVMSSVEPAIATYGRRELQQAFLDEPACRHVVQPFRLDD